jgi:hypothetical protein
MTTAASAVDTPAIEKSPKWWKAIGQRRERVTSMMAATTNTLTSGVRVAMGDNGDRGATTTTMMEKGGLHPTSRTTAMSGAKTTLVTTPFPPSHPGLPQFAMATTVSSSIDFFLGFLPPAEGFIPPPEE